MIVIEIFEYEFMRKAFIVGILIAIIIPCIGLILVLKRLSMVGDALSHSSLAGVALGLILGINPILTAMLFCIISAIFIEIIRKKLPNYSEMSIPIVMSIAIGTAGILSGFVKNSANFNSFLFGSIVSITDFELKFVVIISVIVLITFILLYKELFFITFSERNAVLAGVPVRAVNFIFTILTGVTVSIAARTVGTLIVSSIMVVPVACAIIIAKSYKQALLFSILYALLFTISGLFMAYYFSLKPGATIVLIGSVFFIITLVFKKYKAF